MSGTADAGADAVDAPFVVPQRLRPPRARPDQVQRPELIARLRDADAEVVVVRAGAGYGKSTLLGQLIESDDRAGGWLTLHPSDDDPVVLAHHVLHVLASVGLEVAGLDAQLSGAEAQLWRRVVPGLAAALDRPAEPFLVVLDDTHLVSSTQSWELIDRLVGLVPPGSTIVLSGRTAPVVHRARRAVDGELIELTQADLAFGPAEAQRLVSTMLPDLDERLAGELASVTEGWPAGVHFGVLALRHHDDPPVLLGGLLSSDRQLVDYLHEEVLAGLDSSTREFLVDVSVLPHLSGPLCDATTGRLDSADLLKMLVDSGNLFVSPITGASDEYRIHQLFAELLLRELRRVEPGREATLRRAAAAWEDEFGEADAAVALALAGGDADLAARVVYRHHARMVLSGQTATLERWIGSFPAGATESDALLALTAGWAALSTGRAADARHHLDTARSLEFSGPLPDGTGRFDLACTALAMLASFDGVNGTARDAQTLIDAGDQAGPWAVLARSQHAVASSMLVVADHRERFRSTEVGTRSQPAVHAVTLAQLALAEARHGETAVADELAERAVAVVADADLSGFPMIVLVPCIASLTAALAGDRSRSRRRATDGESLLTIARDIVVRGRLQATQVLAEAALVRGEVHAAGRLLAAARTTLAAQPAAVVLQQLQAELDDRLQTARLNPEIQELSAAERRVLQQLSTHWTLVEIAEHLSVSRNTVKTHTRSIYSKLGVSSRSPAVTRAYELGLLDGDGPGAR